MAISQECLHKMDIEKVGYKFWAIYQCTVNVPLWNDWSKVACSQVHDSPVLKIVICIYIHIYTYIIWRQYLQNSYSLGKVQNLGDPELSEEKT